MGIQAYIFGKKFRKDNASNKMEVDNEAIRHQQLLSLNKRLFDMYQQLTQEQDYFAIKQQQNTSIYNELKSKKCEVEQHLVSLEEKKINIDDKFKNGSTSIQGFKELCYMFVSTQEDIENVQMQLHQSEIELEIHQQSWNDKLLKHNNKITNLQTEIENVVKEIACLNECKI